MDLINFLENYKGADDLEEAERQALLYFLNAFGDMAYSRDNQVGHLSTCSWVVNKERTKLLMAYHNIYQSWAWLGGHADGDKNLCAVAVKEAIEESGLQAIKVISDKPIDINALSVIPHVKRGKTIPQHIHYNAVYLLEGDETKPLFPKGDENKAVKWVKLEDVVSICTEPHVIPYYERVIKKLQNLGKS
jgi:ADP-ribose pyrophosphatase YjhB (NUDIX family)